jgi:Na+-driven multidrug efflux pump
MGVNGAAIATIISQIIANVLFTKSYIDAGNIKGVKVFEYIDATIAKKVIKLGIAPCIESCGFIIFSMIIGRIVASFGATTIAVQKVGSQIEDLSWMTASGFSTALTTFIGQNYGAKKFHRIHEGYRVTIGIAMFVGLIASLILIVFGGPVFSIFIPESEAIKGGIEYLRILGYSQIFMCIEITTAGAFRGLGRTILPSLISIIFTGLRIPMALLLSKTTLGVNGVWWSISGSSIIKGVLLIILFLCVSSKYKNKVSVEEVI